MGQKTRAFLKTQNRDFNNVIDSALNLTDGGTVAGAVALSSTLGVTGASTLTGAVTATAGMQAAAVAVVATADGTGTGTIPAGTSVASVT